MTEDNYEEIKDVLKDYKIENDGIWLSWGDLWRIDGVAVRNAQRAMGRKDGVQQMMLQAYVGQRMLISDLAELVRPKEENNN